MERILLLTQGQDWQDIAAAIRSARTAAAEAGLVSYGLCLQDEPDADSQREMASLGSVLFTCGEGEVWTTFPDLWQGEELVIIADKGIRFLRGWDIKLRTACRNAQKDGKLSAFTGFPPCPDDQLFAMRTVGVREIDEQYMIHFIAGAPIRYAAAPVPSFFLNPGFCFGPAAFFRKAAAKKEQNFLTVQDEGDRLFTANEPLCTAVKRNRIDPVDLSTISVRSEALCRRAGILLEKRLLSGMAVEGIGYPDLRYPMRIPGRRQLEASLLFPMRHRVTPLCVTSITMPDGAALPEEKLSRFRHLTAIRDAAVLCFADAFTARQLMRFEPNVLEYKPHYALRADRRVIMADPENYLRLCRPFLLAQAKERLLTNSHYLWIDFDYLKYPVYEKERIQWEMLCTSKIAIAMVGHQPDPSLIVVPEARIQPLCREIISLCDDHVRRSDRLPEENALWKALIREHPDWFELIDLPNPGELLGIAINSVNDSWKAAEV